LRNKNQGTLHRAGSKKKGEDKWTHTTYPGWVRFQSSLGGVTVAFLIGTSGTISQTSVLHTNSRQICKL
jgi:hypothetical protein